MNLADGNVTVRNGCQTWWHDANMIAGGDFTDTVLGTTQNWGSDPAWSPDGKQIFILGNGSLDSRTGKLINNNRPLLNGKPWSAEHVHWGKLGLLGSGNGFRITLTDQDFKIVKFLCISGVE